MDDSFKGALERLTELVAELSEDDRREHARLIDAMIDSHDRERRSRLRSIVETAVDGIVTIDRHGIVVDYNPAAERMFGYTAEEVVGNNVKMLMPSPYREQHDHYLGDYLETGEAQIIGIGREVVGRRADGSTFPMDLAVSEFQHRGEVHFTGIVRDVTERNALRAERVQLIRQLEDKNAELERFTYTVSHDLKSPLITIRGFLGMLEKDAAAGRTERLQDDIERIAAAADKMKELLEEVLQLSRIGRVANPAENVDMRELVDDVTDLLSAPLDEAGVDVVVRDDLPIMYGDRVRLREVLQNLVENAIKFSRDVDDPKIEIGGGRVDGRNACYVRDNGIGIEPQYQRKVFGLFDQLDQDREGSGVGLALVKRIIDVHGGEVWVESEGAGTGTAVWFTVASPPSETQTDEEEA